MPDLAHGRSDQLQEDAETTHYLIKTETCWNIARWYDRLARAAEELAGIREREALQP